MTTTPSTRAQPIPIATPQTITADPEGIQLAQTANLVRQDPAPAPAGDVRLLNAATNRANRNVLHFNPDWISHDNFFRPVIFNPFGEPLHIFWQIAGVIQEIVIPALGQLVTEISQPGPIPVTAIVPNDSGEPDQVTAAVIDGGGRDPGPGQPPPPPPPALAEYNDTCVAVHYTDAQFKPFRVRKLVDVGDDPQYGERKVLLDGVTPAWGLWSQSTDCATQFVVHKTQSLPGVDDPTEAPLPGGYPMELASYSRPSGLGVFAVLAALFIAALILGAVLVAITVARRNRPPGRGGLPRHGANGCGRTRHGHLYTRVQAVSRPGGSPVVTARETPAPGEATHAIRLEAHFDPGSQTIREVDDDHSRIE